MFIIGISGGTGSGKTTLVNQIIQVFPETEIAIISQDSYYKENHSIKKNNKAIFNFDHPDAIDFELLIEHITQLKKGNPINQPIYSFVNHNRTNDYKLISPKKVLIVEGILTFSNPILLKLLDLKLFIQVDDDERLIRRLKRDIEERESTMIEVIERYQTYLKPMHQQFIEPTKKMADIIIPNDHQNSAAIDVIRALINQRIM